MGVHYRGICASVIFLQSCFVLCIHFLTYHTFLPSVMFFHNEVLFLLVFKMLFIYKNGAEFFLSSYVILTNVIVI